MTKIIPTAQGAVRPAAPAASPQGRRRTTLRDGPHPIDIHVGNRLRLLRTVRGMTQAALGFAVTVTCQQIQKYEGGTNRISASMLYLLGEVLDVPVSFFFDGMDRPCPLSPGLAGVPIKPEEARLLESYQRLSLELRKRVLNLTEAMAESGKA